MDASAQHVHCVCGATVPVPLSQGSTITCPNCAAEIVVDGTRIAVTGNDAKEVRDVAEALAKQEAEHKAERDRVAAERRRAARALAGPWTSGLFYLLAAAVVVGLVLAIAAVVPLWAVPIIVLGAVVILAVVGAMQLRHDDKLSEKGFIALMKLALSEVGTMARSAAPPA